jgi:hypothetical protein
MIEPPHIGNILNAYVKEKRIFKAGWARDTGVTPQTTLRYTHVSKKELGRIESPLDKIMRGNSH